jgi:hypothetical protein
MGIQPLIVLIMNEGYLHGFSHTYLGATLLAIFATLSGKHFSEFGLRVIDIADKAKPIKIGWIITIY